MNRAPGPVGVWSFTRAAWEVARHDEATLRWMAALTSEVLPCLARHQLLLPSRLALDWWWRPLGASWNGSQVVEGMEDMEVPAVPDDLADAERLGDLLVGRARALSAFPMTVHVRGVGAVDDGKGHLEEVPDVARLEVRAVTAVAAMVQTDLDIWLPSDLYGDRQGDVYERNAPRLRTALGELAGLSGVTESHVEHTKYAVVDSLGVINHFDRFGRVVPVIHDRSGGGA